MSEDLLPIVGVAGAAAILGVENTRISRYRREGRMPPTTADLAATPVWSREAVELMVDNGHRYPADAPRPPRRKMYGTAEAALNFGVSKRAITRWREAGIFPEPNEDLGRTPVWTPERLRSFRPPSERRRARAAA